MTARVAVSPAVELLEKLAYGDQRLEAGEFENFPVDSPTNFATGRRGRFMKV